MNRKLAIGSGALLAVALASAAGCSSSSSSTTNGDGGGGSGGSAGSGGTGGSGGHSGTSSGASASGGAGGTAGSGGHPASHGSSASTSGGSTSSSAQSSGATIGGVPGGVAGVGTTLSGCTIFPADNAWNVAVDGPDVQVIHTYDAQLPQGTATHADLGGYTSDNGGIPYNPVPATQALQDTTFTLYASESDPGPGGWIGTDPVTSGAAMGTTKWPFFVGMKIEGNPSKGGTPGNLSGDQHGLVLQQAGSASSACTSYEAWQCVVTSSPPFTCANGAAFDLSSNATRPAGSTSADAAGLSILAGLVRLSEIKAGLVTHAVRVTFNATQKGYIAPATHEAGSQPLGSAYPPMGLRLRMKASVSTSGYTAASQVIMAGMKKYGLLVADNGSDWFFQGDSDDGWLAMAPDGQDTLVDEVVGDYRHITGADFEAVYTGDPVATGQ